MKIHHDGENGELVARPEQGIVLGHALVQIALRPGLDLDVDENALRIPVAGLELGNDVGFAPAPVVKLGEDLRVEKLGTLEVESLLDSGKEQLQEIPEKRVQELLEALVVSHGSSLLIRKRRENRAETSLGVPSTTVFLGWFRFVGIRAAPWG